MPIKNIKRVYIDSYYGFKVQQNIYTLRDFVLSLYFFPWCLKLKLFFF